MYVSYHDIKVPLRCSHHHYSVKLEHKKQPIASLKFMTG